MWRKLLTSLIETGHPWITFKDPSNIRYSNKHVGVVHNSKLCVEILLHTVATTYKEGLPVKVGETAVCNLGSHNLPEIFRSVCEENQSADEAFLVEKFFEKVQKITHTAIRMLDNVIDINFYPTAEARQANMNNRPVGLGEMGFP